jgi:hypothetical protein
MKGIASRASGQRWGSRLRHDGCIAAVLLCLATFAAACAGSPSTSTGSAPSNLTYAQCMRAHGVLNFPDPTGTGQFVLTGIDTHSAQFQAAVAACKARYGSATSGQNTNAPTDGLKFARCMRAHGVANFPDPSANGQNSASVSQGAGQTPVFLFQRALTTCRPLLAGASSSSRSTP